MFGIRLGDFDSADFINQDTAVSIDVNLRLKPFRDYCLTIKARSPLAPLKKGGTGIFSKSPFLRGATAVLGPPQVEQVAWI